MVEFGDLVGKLTFSIIVIFAVMMFVVQLQESNDAVSKIDNNSIFNNSLTEMSTQIDTATSEAGEKYDVFNEETPQPGFGSIILFGIVSVGKTFSTIVFGFFTVIIKLPLVVFGVPASTFNLLLVWLIIAVIVAVWRLYKLGG